MKFLIVPENDLVRELYSNHSTYHEGDSGLDLFIAEDCTIPPRSTYLVDLRVKTQLTDGIKYYSYNIYARSSIAKSPLILANGVGLADAGYLGNLKAAFYNTSSVPFTVRRGERYVQLARADLGEISFEIVDSFGDRETSRGTGGLGSTSK